MVSQPGPGPVWCLQAAQGELETTSKGKSVGLPNSMRAGERRGTSAAPEAPAQNLKEGCAVGRRK